MKKISLVIFLFTLISLSSFAQAIFSERFNKVLEPTNHSYLTKESVGSEIHVEGILSVKNNNFALIENPNSKSAVTFKLEVKKYSLKRKLRKLNGKKVQLTGVVTDASSTWTKKMKVLKVEQK